MKHCQFSFNLDEYEKSLSKNLEPTDSDSQNIVSEVETNAVVENDANADSVDSDVNKLEEVF